MNISHARTGSAFVRALRSATIALDMHVCSQAGHPTSYFLTLRMLSQLCYAGNLRTTSPNTRQFTGISIITESTKIGCSKQSTH